MAGHKKFEYTPRKQTKSIVIYDPGKEQMEKIAGGGTIGRDFIIELDKPITANVIKLIIHKASERPGVWEIEVNSFEPAK